MTRLEKIELATKRGYTCDIETGKVYGVRGNELLTFWSTGYKVITLKNNGKTYMLYQHHFIYYNSFNKIVDEIDHINGDRLDNRIENLRQATRKQNQHNRKKTKGYSWNKSSNKWHSQLGVDGKIIYLGLFNTEMEAHQAYLDAKKIYHII